LGATSYYKRCFGGLEKKVKELCPRYSLVGTIGYLGEHFKGEELADL